MRILGLLSLVGLVSATVFRVVLRKEDNWDALSLAPETIHWGPEMHPRDVLNMSEIVECENGQFGSCDAHTDR
jgi:hypothetical protein